MKKLVARLVSLMLPLIMEELVKQIEDIINIDLNNDGNVGSRKE